MTDRDQALTIRRFFEHPAPRSLRDAPPAIRPRLRKLVNESRVVEAVLVGLATALLGIGVAQGAAPGALAAVAGVAALVLGPFLYFFHRARRRNRALVLHGRIVEGRVTRSAECVVGGIHGRALNGVEVDVAYELDGESRICNAVLTAKYAEGKPVEIGSRVDLVVHPDTPEVIVLDEDRLPLARP